MGFNTAFLPYGETLRQHRKIFHQILRAEVSVSYHKMYSRHANKLVISLLGASTTNDLQQHTEAFVPNSVVSLRCMVQLTIIPCDRYTASLILAVAYGHLADGHEGSFRTRAHELLNITKDVISPEKAAMFTAFPFRECLCQRHNLERLA